MLKPVQPKQLDLICQEWDLACTNRHNAILNGQDISLQAVTGPCILNDVQREAPSSVLDIGCGTGYLTSEIAKNVDKCYGIDCSLKSIQIAQKEYSKNNISFIHTALEDFNPDVCFDMCVSNMVLTCDPIFRSSLKKINNLMHKSGSLLIMITHPCFWPKYWNFEQEPWFAYNKEIFIEHDFSISLVKSMGKATYIHRPMDMYISAIKDANFEIEDIKEPYPLCIVPKEYQYEYPRFLYIKCKKK